MLFEDEALASCAVDRGSEPDNVFLEVDVRPPQSQRLTDPASSEKYEVEQVRNVQTLEVGILTNCLPERRHSLERNRTC